ncbi:2-oxoacid:acceptor oxidoreductase family protein [Geoalkalibacter halelectricus]|uniref:2-oxoacid:acceptor oxidoreductase family protein n=1 Tax=Geoalkalibacter halelectricus TaxID=2847045 RepID=A0ABY5ZMF2_9BACT|nr:2-oxoacid:acceptor oxidoreductase family protein [Geoalkalibacter halelectricus]MDO3376817.1 2-oxoacid:acceptor oxidoreductase family protein [Geoalkalibacter halelectricus]UWZ79117.1 2-oxoacid:acceptor oxidoreductase family protein [Geoalkalibacter halelectricus]
MAQRFEIRFSGAGGQGLITAGIILAEAASIVEGKFAVQSQSYGPEARGGASKSEVIISDGPIDYPKATIVDACLAMTQEAADKYANGIKSGGVLLLDADFVPNEPKGDFKIVRMPIMRTAKEDIGREIVANVVALGAMIALTDCVSREAGEKAVLSRVPEAFIELNKKAYSLGFEKVKALIN